MSHPNILELVGVVMNESEFIMVAPWMENGNIVDHVREDPHANPLKLVRDMSCLRDNLLNLVAAGGRHTGS